MGLLLELNELLDELEDVNDENRPGTKASKGMPNAPTSEHTTIRTMMMGSLEPIQYPKSKPRGWFELDELLVENDPRTCGEPGWLNPV